MEPQWINEQEASYTWLVNSSANEQEDVMDWIKSIGVGAAQGAGTGAVAGPWGALIGGLLGGGLGALQQATQPAPQRPAAPPARPPAPPPARPAATAATPPAAVPSAPPSARPAAANRDTAGAVQQIVQMLPQLLQLVQTAQQAGGRSGESAEQAENRDVLAGDHVPDGAFLENSTEDEPIESLYREDGSDEEPKFPRLAEEEAAESIPIAPAPHPAARLGRMHTLTFPGEWSTEGESASLLGAGFQWAS